MALYRVQLENQARPVFSRWEGGPLDALTAVVVKTEDGPIFGEVMEDRSFMARAVPVHMVLETLREATEEDRIGRRRHRRLEREAFLFCRDHVINLGLEMKISSVGMCLDESRMLFFYTSEKRGDFRELTKVLAHRFKVRIEMRQIGVRDEAKLLGGCGYCGRPLCCSTHLNQFYPVTIKMAKEQGLSLNPAKISGRCGRLMCCIRYECPSRSNGGNCNRRKS